MFMSLIPLTSAYGERGGSITVEIDTDTNAMIMDEFKANECAPESFYWKHHESVFGGYEGCVGENIDFPVVKMRKVRMTNRFTPRPPLTGMVKNV